MSATGLLSPSGALLLLALPFLPRLIQGTTALDEEASLLQGKVPLNTHLPALGLPQSASPASPASNGPCRKFVSVRLMAQL
jgi:hypothetical protein